MSLRIAILGSGSSGNAAFVSNGRTRVLVDAGFSCRALFKRLREIGEDPARLDAILISHEHSDHVAGLPQTAKKTGVPVYLTERTARALDWSSFQPPLETFAAGGRIVIGDLELDSFTIPHDAVDPVGFCVRWGGFKIGLVTDLGYLTQSVKHRLRGCDMLVLESNHDVEMLRVGPYPWFVKQRVLSRTGHLSNEAVADFLTSDFDRSTRFLILAHLSGANNHPGLALKAAAEALERAGASATRVEVASQERPSEVFEF